MKTKIMIENNENNDNDYGWFQCKLNKLQWWGNFTLESMMLLHFLTPFFVDDCGAEFGAAEESHKIAGLKINRNKAIDLQKSLFSSTQLSNPVVHLYCSWNPGLKTLLWSVQVSSGSSLVTLEAIWQPCHLAHCCYGRKEEFLKLS